MTTKYHIVQYSYTRVHAKCNVEIPVFDEERQGMNNWAMDASSGIEEKWLS